MVSVIVPVWNDAVPLKALLRWLADEPGILEIIVADGGSRDDTLAAIAEHPSIRFVQSGRGRGRQMNTGAAVARGDILLFLHADTFPPSGAIEGLPVLLDSQRADFGAFQVRFDPPVWLPQLLAWFTRFAFPCTCFGDQGIFVRRDFFWSIGGFPEAPLLEDVHWVKRASRLGRMTRSPYTVITSARRFQEIGTVRQTWRNLSILIRDRLGTDLETLAALYGKGCLKEELGSPAVDEVVEEEPVGERG